ncbi:MAG TPA: PTS sugar transporter subunit IIA [Rhodopila sp.]|jgi:PTS system nitrogen regulatory IIA component|nr:PTS sugar transporter subunit IIA [Rhodopila sp.]
MEITELLAPDRVILDVRSRDKTQLIGEIARIIARSAASLSLSAIESALLAREQLGSTGLGGGFALPHARIDGLGSYLGLFVRLAKPLDFAAIDGKPVRLVFVLLIPGETAVPHVTALAAISRRFREPGFAAKLLTAETPAVAYDLLTGQA